MQVFILVAGTLALTTYCQLMIKGRALAHMRADVRRSKLQYLLAMFTDIGTWSAFAAAVVAAACWTLAVRQAPLTLVYPFMSLSFLLVPLLSAVLFKEPVTLRQGVGLALIVVGVAVVGIAHQP
jgi:drug/metabolite transporter (DMT)-like permease